VLTLQQFLSLKVVFHSHLIVFDNYESKIKRQLFFNQVFTQKSIVTEIIIIYWKLLIKSNPGSKNFARELKSKVVGSNPSHPCQHFFKPGLQKNQQGTLSQGNSKLQ